MPPAGAGGAGPSAMDLAKAYWDPDAPPPPPAAKRSPAKKKKKPVGRRVTSRAPKPKPKPKPKTKPKTKPQAPPLQPLPQAAPAAAARPRPKRPAGPPARAAKRVRTAGRGVPARPAFRIAEAPPTRANVPAGGVAAFIRNVAAPLLEGREGISEASSSGRTGSKGAATAAGGRGPRERGRGLAGGERPQGDPAGGADREAEGGGPGDPGDGPKPVNAQRQLLAQVAQAVEADPAAFEPRGWGGKKPVGGLVGQLQAYLEKFNALRLRTGLGAKAGARPPQQTEPQPQPALRATVVRQAPREGPLLRCLCDLDGAEVPVWIFIEAKVCKQRNLAPGTRVTVHPPYEEVAMHGAPNVVVCTYSAAFD